MSQLLDEQISAFLDGELPAEEVELVLERLDRDPSQRARLGRYALIGECLRTGAASTDALGLVERVRPALVADPLDAPGSYPSRRGRPMLWMGGGLAAAASVAAVVLLSPAFRPVETRQAPTAAAVASARIEPEIATVTPGLSRRLDPRSAGRLTGYLVAHGAYSNPIARSALDSHLVSARAERAAWSQSREVDDAP